MFIPGVPEFLRPIVQAPMGGGAGTSELAAAVCNAGGLGSLGVAYLKPDQIAEQIRRVRAQTSNPFNVNLFAGSYRNHTEVGNDAYRPMLDFLEPIHHDLGLPPPEIPDVLKDPFNDQLDVILAARPAVFSFTFGIPDSDAIRRLKARGIAIIGTATNLAEGQMLEAAGVSAIVAQGAEAGAHRGTFIGAFEDSMIPTTQLVKAIRSTTTLPIIASGGIMDSGDVARVLAVGACAAQLGTAFITCPESGAAEAWKKAILDAGKDTTVITRVFSGRPARGLTNRFIELLAGREDMVLPYPLQNALTAPMRKAAALMSKSGYLSLWAGRGVARARAMPAAVLIERLTAEMENRTKPRRDRGL